METGRVVDVTSRIAGSELTTATVVGQTSLNVADAADFFEGGGRVAVVTGADTRITYAFTALAEAEDGSGTLNLAAPLDVAYPLGTRVEVEPRTVEVWAQVSAGDGDPLECRVPHALRPMLGEGVRDQTEGETVRIAERDGEWFVQDVAGQAPTLDGDVELRGSLRVIDAAGNIVMSISGVDGTITTGPDGAKRVVLKDTPSGGQVLFQSGQAGQPSLDAAVFASQSDRGGLLEQLNLLADFVFVDGSLELVGDLYVNSNASVISRDGWNGPRTDLTVDALALRIDTGTASGVLRLYGDRVASRNAADTARAPLLLTGSVVDLDADAALLRVRDAPDAGGKQIWNLDTCAVMITAGNAVRSSNATGAGYQPMQASAFNVNSDAGQKRGVREVKPGALAQVRALRPVDFEREGHGRRRYRGLVAQEVAQAMPAAHVPAHPDEGDGHEGVDLMALCVTQAQAIQELADEVDRLRSALRGDGT